MARRSYNKLVRDKVPAAIVDGGDEAITTVLEDKQDILLALDEKLDEEVCDYQVTKDLAELADVLEVIHAIVETVKSAGALAKKFCSKKSLSNICHLKWSVRLTAFLIFYSLFKNSLRNFPYTIKDSSGIVLLRALGV